MLPLSLMWGYSYLCHYCFSNLYRNQMSLLYCTSSTPAHLHAKKEEQFENEPFCLPSAKQEPREGNEGRWEEQENLKFAVFIAYYQPIFASRHQRKHSKIFKSLAEYIGQRTAPQCRSHFQKLLIKHKTAAKIKKFYREAFGQERFDAQYARFQEEWEQSHFPLRRTHVAVREFKETATQTEDKLVEEAACPAFPTSQAWGMVKAENLSYLPCYLPAWL